MSLKLAADTALTVLLFTTRKRKEQLCTNLVAEAVPPASQTQHSHTFGGNKRSGHLLSTYYTGQGFTYSISNPFNNSAGPELFPQRRNPRFREVKKLTQGHTASAQQ